MLKLGRLLLRVLLDYIECLLILALSVQDVGILKGVLLLLSFDSLKRLVKALSLDLSYHSRFQSLVLAFVNLEYYTIFK